MILKEDNNKMNKKIKIRIFLTKQNQFRNNLEIIIIINHKLKISDKCKTRVIHQSKDILIEILMYRI